MPFGGKLGNKVRERGREGEEGRTRIQVSESGWEKQEEEMRKTKIIGVKDFVMNT